MKILLTGKNGQVGWELQRTLAPLGEVTATGRDEIDLAKPDSIRAWVRDAKPDLIVNAAAYTAVDKAESEPELAMTINGVAPGIIAEEAKKLGAILVHYSTDYVFDGAKDSPYTEEDTPNPVNVYGKTKLAGERAVEAAGCHHLILRTGWVYGIRGKNFLLTILRLAKERDELRIVDDQIGAPTWSRTIAEATANIIEHSLVTRASPAKEIERPRGIYHLSAAGRTSWFGFASAALGYMESRTKLTPIPSSGYPLPAKRPANSVLSNSKLFEVFRLENPDWNSALRLCLREV